MKDLKIGDRIITQNPMNGLITNTLVFGFLDYDQHAWSPLIEIKYQIHSNLIQQQQGLQEEEQQQEQNSIYLTEDHLIFIYDNTTISNNNNINSMNKKAVFASSVKKGQIIFVYNHNYNYNNSNELMKAEIISVQLRNSLLMNNNNNNTNNNTPYEHLYKIGLYAPITDTGTMIVDNVLVSCFAYISNHELASLIIWPWKLIYKLLLYINIFIELFQSNEYNESDLINSNGIPWFIQWIYKLMYEILPDSQFYKSTSFDLNTK
ncbi:unnamed protein product [Schistosoma spindalis]|nr:unnamed protein product [Schistosoma spindale]